MPISTATFWTSNRQPAYGLASTMRLKLARALAKTVVTTQAINQYQVYLCMRPADQAIRREFEVFNRTLTARGHATDMTHFNAILHLGAALK